MTSNYGHNQRADSVAELEAVSTPPARQFAPRPLMSMSAVTWRLDCNEQKVRTLIEEGRLLWAFAVGLDPLATIHSVRVLTKSVEDYLAGNTTPSGDEEAEWESVRHLIFPDKTTVVTAELERVLNCGKQHVHNLINAGQFRLAPGSRCRPGPGGSHRIVTASVAEWLRQRRLL
jgi:hypothetical protein